MLNAVKVRLVPGKSKVFFFHKGESMLDNLLGRFSRPRDLYRQFLPEVFRKAGVPEGTKAKWSQKAGCSCGCSPGFVLDYPGWHIYVDLDGVPAVQ